MRERKEEKEIKPNYIALLQEIGESCEIILLLRFYGYEFDRPAMAAERAHIFQLLEIFLIMEETKRHVEEICEGLAYHAQRMPPSVAEIIKNTRDRIWPYENIPPSAKKR